MDTQKPELVQEVARQMALAMYGGYPLSEQGKAEWREWAPILRGAEAAVGVFNNMATIGRIANFSADESERPENWGLSSPITGNQIGGRK